MPREARESTGSPGPGAISDLSLLTVMLGVEIRSSAKATGTLNAEPFLQPPTLYVCIYTHGHGHGSWHVSRGQIRQLSAVPSVLPPRGFWASNSN